ncbi:MAG: hypothetical protein LKF31_09655 [Muribaculaceae bacterium]|jgi:hypothetical protein|nr:hypothetical protein [Muribaculaceae bacterium]
MSSAIGGEAVEFPECNSRIIGWKNAVVDNKEKIHERNAEDIEFFIYFAKNKPSVGG